MTTKRNTLTALQLEAIIEALVFRLAGEIEYDDDATTHEHYDEALGWALGRKRKRQRGGRDAEE